MHVNVDLYHTTNRTATTNGPISLAQAAGLGKYGYGNGFTVMERISRTILRQDKSQSIIWSKKNSQKKTHICEKLHFKEPPTNLISILCHFQFEVPRKKKDCVHALWTTI